MAGEQEKPVENTLDDFTGTVSEQRQAKIAFINKHGLAAFEQLVVRSNDPSYKRPKK